jgi:hypothetical protein
VNADNANPANEKPALNPSSMAVVDAAKMLTRAGGQAITVAMLQADLEAGMPANPDGTLNLVHCAAWLVREMHAHD